MKEEITDILTPEGIRSGQFSVGQVLKFSGGVNIKITKLLSKKGRAWGQHIELVAGNVAYSHNGHDVSSGEPGDLPFCNDCQVSINEHSTEDGEVKAAARKESEDVEE